MCGGDSSKIYPQIGRIDRRSEQIIMNASDYGSIVESLAAEDGGGFVAIVPDLPGCMSDGESPQEAVANVQDAIRTWIEAAKDLGHTVPKPTRRIALIA